MNIKENITLAPYTTFKIGGPARYFCPVKNDRELVTAVNFAKKNNLRILVLGGGSNILVSDNGFPGLVIKNEYKGVSFRGDLVKAAAGELWDELVEKTVSRGLYGLENLSAIPGTVGAAPIQNIGAYGADVSTSISEVRVYDVVEMRFRELSNAECDFKYRDSIFKKSKNKSRYIVTHVFFDLKSDSKVNIEYRDLAKYFENKKKKSPTLSDVRQAVIDIRWGKLPDWKLWGTAGSFFKNPTISRKRFEELKKKYPGLPGFPETDNPDKVKVSLAWILDKVCDVKDLCVGEACVYEKQALVFVTRSGASASQVVDLARGIEKRVKEKTQIDIEAEVEWVN